MAQHIKMSPDGRWMVFTANAGTDPRRHLVKVPVDRAAVDVVTPGAGLEWSPALTGDVPLETLVIVADTHHFMRHANWLKVGGAAADFFRRKLRP